VQLQNLPRGKIVKDVMAAIEAVLLNTPLDQIETNFGPPMVVFGELVRPLIVARREDWLARGDYSQIEARVNPWLAGETSNLEAFKAYDRGEGPDNYIVTAAKMYRVPASDIDKDDPRRQSGKVTDLACGFQGGKGALLRWPRSTA
jgi:DNA polymerase